MRIKLKRDIKTTPEWVFPAIYIRAGETVNCFPATNLPYDGAVWIDDSRTCNIYGSFLSSVCGTIVKAGEYSIL